jgi:DNA primase
MTSKPLIKDILARYGIEYTGKPIKCPLPGHNEKTGSFSVYSAGKRAHCFGCGFDGDAGDLVAALEQIPLSEALKKLDMQTGFHTLKVAPTPEPERPQIPDSTIEILTAFYESLAPIADSSPGRQYLEGRGIDTAIASQMGVRVIGEPGAVYDAMAARFGRERMQVAGLFSSKGKAIFFRQSLVFPHRADGNIVYLTSRILEDNQHPKSFKLGGNLSTPYPGLPSGPGNVLVCEGQIDCVAAYQLFGDEIPAVTFCGLPSPSQIQQIGAHRTILALDFDQAGQKHSEKLIKQFPGVGFFRWADYLQAEGLEGVKDFADITKQKGLSK